MLEIRLLGQFDARHDGHPVDLASRPGQSLFAYLVLNSGIAHRREKLAGMFWPEADDRQARSNLRYTLWQVRRALEASGAEADQLLQADKITVTFTPGPDLWLDAALLAVSGEGSGETETLQRAASAYGGDLLPGFYDEWVLLERDRLTAAYDRVMSTLLERLAAEGRWAATFEWAERWISHGQVPEAAYRALMRGHAALGDASGLAAAYTRSRDALRQQLGVEPSSLTTQLYRDLSREVASPAVQAAAPGPQGQILGAEPGAPDVAPRFLVEEAPASEARKFAGRAREIGRLMTLLKEVQQGHGTAAAVIGEAGSGKSALVEEFSRRAEAEVQDLLVLTGKCDLYTGAGDPYLPFREVLSMLAGDVEPRWAAGSISRERARRLWAASSRVGRLLADQGADLVGPFVHADILRARAGGLAPEAGSARIAESDRIAPPPHRSRLFEEYGQVLRATAEANPLLIILEDVHWLDPSSADLLAYLLQVVSDRRMFVLITYRPEEITAADSAGEHPLARVLSDLKEKHGAFWIDLDSPQEPSGRDLVDALIDLRPNALDAEFRSNLARVTGGHPLFVLELLQDMEERAELVTDPSGTWVLAGPINWQVIPAKVDGVIEKRISRLDPELREALVVASVQGEVFTAEAIARVQGVDERALVRRLSRELEAQHRLVTEAAAERVGRRQLSQFRFRHILIQRYLYQRLGQSERAYLHESLGRVLEELYAEDLGRAAHRLARHFSEASLDQPAAEYLRRAGEQALQVSAYREAVAHLTQARSMLLSTPGRDERSLLELERLLGEALYGLGDLQASGEHLERAAALLGWPVPRGMRGLGPAVVGEILRQAVVRILPWKSRPVAGAPSELYRTAAQVHKLLAEIYVVRQAHALTLYASLRGLNLAERGGPSPELAQALADMSAVCPLLGVPQFAETYRRLAYRTAEIVAADSVTAYVLLATSVFTVGEARWDDSRDSLDRALQLFRRLGDWNRLGITLTFRAHVDLFQAEFSTFVERLKELERLADRSGSFLHRIWAMDGQAEAILRAGSHASLRDVEPALLSSLRQIRNLGWHTEEAVIYGLLAQTHLRLGQWTEAVEAAASARERTATSPPTFYSELEGYAGPVEAYLGSWEHLGNSRGQADEKRLAAALKDLRRFARIFPVARPRTIGLEAWNLWLSGRLEAAEREWTHSARQAKELQMPFEEAQAYAELGRHLPAANPSRLDHLRRALTMFRDLHAVSEVARLETLLGGSSDGSAAPPRRG